MLNVKIPWKPHAKQRPRMTKTGHAYTPKATKEAEAAIAEAFLKEVPKGYEPYDGPIMVRLVLSDHEVEIVIEEHPEHSHRKLKGDIDNYIKTIADALNGVAWVDDKQIEKIIGVKL